VYNSQAGKVREGGPSEAPDDQVYFYFRPNSEKEDLAVLPLLEGQARMRKRKRRQRKSR